MNNLIRDILAALGLFLLGFIVADQLPTLNDAEMPFLFIDRKVVL